MLGSVDAGVVLGNTVDKEVEDRLEAGRVDVVVSDRLGHLNFRNP